MSGQFTGKVVLVTGGSRGIGRAISERFAKDGARVFVNYSSSPAAAEEVVTACRAAGAQADAIGFNVSVSAEVDKAIESIKTTAGSLDVLVNNAGISKDGLLMRFKDDDWATTLGVNLNGSFYCARAASKIMLRQKSGRIVNVGSVVGEMGNAGQAAYVASKAGVIGLTKSMAKELGSRSITVNCVTPGFIDTDMTKALSEELKEKYVSGIPLARFGLATEVAGVVAFLAGPDSAYITGQVLGVNGGMYM